MTLCQHCKAQTQLYLCENCTTNLANMLDQLPWLLDELDARIQKRDRISVGTSGRNRRPDQLNVIDFDACDQARKIRKLLLRWVETIAQRHSGRKPPALTTVTTKWLARWLYVNVDAIAHTDLADKGRHPLFDDIARLVGTGPQDKGQLINAINPHERHFAGPCPTTTGHDNHGEPITCGTALYADIDDTTVVCPECKQAINVEKNRRDTEIARDLMTETKLLGVMDDVGEHLPRVKFYQWKRELRIRPKGWLNKNHGVLERTDPRRLRGDPAVYSLARARKLLARTQPPD